MCLALNWQIFGERVRDWSMTVVWWQISVSSSHLSLSHFLLLCCGAQKTASSIRKCGQPPVGYRSEPNCYMLRGRSSFQQHYDSFITMDNSLANVYSSSFWARWVREDLQLKSHRWRCESHTGHSLMSCKRWFYWQPPCFVSLHICGYPTAILLFWDLSPEVRLQSHWPRDRLAASWQALGH